MATDANSESMDYQHSFERIEDCPDEGPELSEAERNLEDEDKAQNVEQDELFARQLQNQLDDDVMSVLLENEYPSGEENVPLAGPVLPASLDRKRADNCFISLIIWSICEIVITSSVVAIYWDAECDQVFLLQ